MCFECAVLSKSRATQRTLIRPFTRMNALVNSFGVFGDEPLCTELARIRPLAGVVTSVHCQRLGGRKRFRAQVAGVRTFVCVFGPRVDLQVCCRMKLVMTDWTFVPWFSLLAVVMRNVLFEFGFGYKALRTYLQNYICSYYHLILIIC